jgi:putative endonuclease
MITNTKIGKKGEEIAVRYLVQKGYDLVALNWRYKHKEIDILANDGDWLVVVEVKLRSSDSYGDPAEFVTLKKQRFLIEAAEAYLDTIPSAPEVRFDVISIVGSEGNYNIEHITDAFNPNP